MAVKNFNVPFTSVDGIAFVKEDKSPIFLKDVIADVLCGNYQDEQSLSGIDKFMRGKLALKVKAEDQNNFEIEELAMIKDIIGKRASVPVVYQTFNILEE